MMGPNLSEVAALLLDANGPRDAARRTLSWLLEHYEARSVALWCTDGDGIRLELSCAADEESIEGARRLWTEHSELLASGRAAIGDNRALVPTKPPDCFVYLDGIDPRRLDLVFTADAAAVAVKALRRTSATLTSRARSGSLQREELIATLQLHEWNIARVARVKGVTRKTIYDWLARYEIPRERVRKS